MQIVVASGNIFRRELAVFVLSEAGHHVMEVSDAAALLEHAALTDRQLIIVDVLLARGAPAELRRQLGERTRAPILWMAHSPSDLPASPDAPPDGWLGWPYNPDDLVRQVGHLAERLPPSDILRQALQQRYARDRS